MKRVAQLISLTLLLLPLSSSYLCSFFFPLKVAVREPTVERTDFILTITYKKKILLKLDPLWERKPEMKLFHKILFFPVFFLILLLLKQKKFTLASKPSNHKCILELLRSFYLNLTSIIICLPVPSVPHRYHNTCKETPGYMPFT